MLSAAGGAGWVASTLIVKVFCTRPTLAVTETAPTSAGVLPALKMRRQPSGSGCHSEGHQGIRHGLAITIGSQHRQRRDVWQQSGDRVPQYNLTLAGYDADYRGRGWLGGLYIDREGLL